jgi:PKD repeat protein
MNDVTTTKQSVTVASGIVVLASNKATKRYWHADLSAGAPAPGPGPVVPAASFSASVTGGQAPVAVQFTDTSTGSPTSWEWDFGDGSTASVQNPAHTFTAAGTYTVTLTASNAAGRGVAASATVTVTPPAPAPGGRVGVGASSTAGATAAVRDVRIPRPTGVARGDVLIAQITADAAPSMSTVPAGWTAVLSGPLTLVGNARVFVYSHVVGDPATEPADYGWQLSAAQKWNAAVTAFSGVDTADPFDTAASTAVSTSYSTTRLTVPGVSTVTDGAMLVGGFGMDSSAAGVTPPADWTEAVESSGGQTAVLAHRSMPTTGPGGAATWAQPKATASAGWIRALRPAA